MSGPLNKVAILGVGLIGGSVGLVCRERGLAKEVVGWDRSEASLKTASQAGAIQWGTRNLPEAVRGAELVMLATPVGSFEGIARNLVTHLPAGAIVTDAGSVKGALVGRLERICLSRGMRFVGGHPIAGRETSGVEAASASLFQGALCVVTPTRRAEESAIVRVRRLWEAAGAEVVFMDPLLHDRLLAVVSHLPHMAAYSLVAAAQDARKRHRRLFTLTGGGFRDFTRVAASSPEMWRDICLLNGKNIIGAISAYERRLARLKRMIVREDGRGLLLEFARARSVKDAIG